MKTRTQTAPQTAPQNAKQAKRARVNKTYGAAQMERFGDYILSHDGTRGGYTYGNDWSGDDLRALCDIFGA